MTVKTRRESTEAAMRSEKVSKIFDEIEVLLREALELGASNQRMKLGLRHLLQKYTRDRG